MHSCEIPEDQTRKVRANYWWSGAVIIACRNHTISSVTRGSEVLHYLLKKRKNAMAILAWRNVGIDERKSRGRKLLHTKYCDIFQSTYLHCNNERRKFKDSDAALWDCCTRQENDFWDTLRKGKSTTVLISDSVIWKTQYKFDIR